MPQRTSPPVFVTDGIASAIESAKAADDGKHVKLSGTSPCQQALAAGLVDEILIHLPPYLLGGGVRLRDHFQGPIRSEKLSATDGPLATHLRCCVRQN